MIDPYCEGCKQVTGGCWRHNGTGLYAFNKDGVLVQIAWPTIIAQTEWSTLYGWTPPLVLS